MVNNKYSLNYLLKLRESVLFKIWIKILIHITLCYFLFKDDEINNNPNIHSEEQNELDIPDYI